MALQPFLRAGRSASRPKIARNQPLRGIAFAVSRDRAFAVPKAGWVPFFRNLVPVAPECHTFRHHGAYARIDRAGYIFGQDLQSRPAVSGQTPRLRPDADSPS